MSGQVSLPIKQHTNYISAYFNPYKFLNQTEGQKILDRMVAGISEIQSGPFIRGRNFHLLGFFLPLLQRSSYLPLCFILSCILFMRHEHVTRFLSI